MIPEWPTDESIRGVLDVMLMYEVWTPEALGYANDVKSAEYVKHMFGWMDRISDILAECGRTCTVAVLDGCTLYPK